MFIIKETNGTKGVVFEKWYLDYESGKKQLIKKVDIWSVEVTYDRYQYMYLYDSNRKVLSEVFEYLNFGIGEQSENTRGRALAALKSFFSFMELYNLDYKNLTISDISKLKDFLYGRGRRGAEITLELSTSRGADTVNLYVGVYRKFLENMGIKNSVLSRKSTAAKFKQDTGLLGHSKKMIVEKYKDSEKSQQENRKVPMYIKVNEFARILKTVRERFSLREEIIIRLMFECGLRIGEVLGLTIEDIVTSTADTLVGSSDGLGEIIIRNRLSDKKYQLAKNCLVPKDTNKDSLSAYETEGVGFHNINPTILLIQKIDEYIETAHGTMSGTNRNNYLKYAKADKLTLGKDLETEDNYYIFLNKNGTRLSKSGWNKILRKIFLYSGLKIDKERRKHNLNHRFRHGFAMFLKKYLNKSALDLMYALRHSSLSSVACYFRPDDDDLFEANTKAALSLYKVVPELMD